jgi:hypothetical protein
MDKNKGDITIELCGASIPEYESILQDALRVLYQRDISVSVDKKPEEKGRYIVIDVKI